MVILQELMKKIRDIESNWAEDGDEPWNQPASSSYHPVDPTQAKATDAQPLGADSSSCSSTAYLPCHYFDYMAGTSTGGLIGIMLGRLRMCVDDCIAEYETLGGAVFGKPRWCHLRSALWLPREKYNYKKLEAVIQDLVDRRVPKIGTFPGGKTFAFDENRCRVAVVSYQENPGNEVEQTYLFRTYKNFKPISDGIIRNFGPAHDIEILKVARATSAAPGYFKEVDFDGLRYVDGGFGANNPCAEIYREVRGLNNEDRRCIGLVLSIGTGKNNEKRMAPKKWRVTGLGKFIHYENFARKWASDSEGAHFTMQDNWEQSDRSFKYHRLNVENGLARMKLDEWKCRGPLRTGFGQFIAEVKSKGASQHIFGRQHEDSGEKRPASSSDNNSSTALGTHSSGNVQSVDESLVPAFFMPKNKTLDTIREETQAYLKRTECQTWLQECAQYLVENRRARVRSDPDRWQRTCFGTWYRCQIRGCQRGQKEYPDARSMEKHLLDKHRETFSDSSEEAKRTLEQTVMSYRITVD